MVFFFIPVFSGRTVPLPEISKPQRIYIDSNQVFITEGATIYIYSLENLKLQNKFGKRGEGPGEFRESGEGVFLIFKPEHIQVISSGRLSIFSQKGCFIREEIISNPRRFEFQSLGDWYVGTALHAEKGRVFFTVNLFDNGFKKLKEIYRYRHPFFPRHKPIDPADLRISTYIVYQNRIYYDDEAGAIHVLDQTGKELYIIPRVSDSIKITDTHKKRYLYFWKTDLKPEYDAFRERLRFSTYFPYIRNFHIADERIYVITFKERGINSEILVLDLRGKLQKKTWAPLAETNMLIPLGFNHYTIHRNSIYILNENDETEEWELVIEEIN